MYRALGQWCFTNWGKVLLAWVAIFIGVGGASGAVGGAFSAVFEIPDSESRDGFDAIDEYFGGFGSGQPASIVFRSERGVDDPEVVEVMNEVFAFTQALDPEAIRLTSPYGGPEPSPQVAANNEIAFADISIDQDVDTILASEWGIEIREHADELVAEAGLEGDLQIETGGQILSEFEPPETELIGLSFAVIVLILAFGSVMAMGLPIGVAVAGVGTGISIITLLSNAISIPDFAIQLGAMIGLGVGIDYALFIVTRYRNSLAAGHAPIDAVGIAIDTAGRAVVFAGLTVVVSLLGMLLIGLAFISGLGIGAASTVAVTMVASITLLPALLGMVGDRVEVSRVRGVVAAGIASVALFLFGLGILPITPPNLLAVLVLMVVVLFVGSFVPFFQRIIPHRPEKPIRETWAYRWSRLIQAHPWLALMVGGGILLLLAAPVLSLRLGFSDEGNFPEDTSTRQAYDLLAEGFGDGFNGPILVAAVLDSPAEAPQVDALAGAIRQAEGVEVVVAAPNNFDDPASSDAYLLRVIPTNGPQAAETAELVETLRDDIIPGAVDDGVTVSVTGAVAANIDFTKFLSARILVFFGVVLALSFLLLMSVFRSIVVPIKAVVMNVLSIASAYGIVVAIFQWGWFGDLFGIEPAPIEPFIPMMLFAIVFGLSMDYEVFLLSRVKEEYERTGDPRNSVADGLAATARVITAAAAIMIVVFGAFMLEDNRIIKLFGLGLGMAVFLDASLVRLLLVPATMELLGARNWWLPGWLDRIIPNLNVEGTEPPAPGGPTEVGGPEPEPDPETDPEPALT